MKLLLSILTVLNILLFTDQEDLRLKPSGVEKMGNEDNMKKVIYIIDKRLPQEKFNRHKQYFHNSGDSNIRNELKTEADNIFSSIKSLKRNMNVKKANESFETSDEIKDFRKMMLNDTSSSAYHGESGHLTRRFWSGFNKFFKGFGDMMGKLSEWPFFDINKTETIQTIVVDGKTMYEIRQVYPSKTIRKKTKISGQSDTFKQPFTYYINRGDNNYFGPAVANGEVYYNVNQLSKNIPKKYKADVLCFNANVPDNFKQPIT